MPNESNLLEHRIIDNLVADAQYLDELHHNCNLRPTDGLSPRCRFRLAEIIIGLRVLTEEGLVRTHTDTFWPEDAGIGRVIFTLTDAGRAYWSAQIKNVDRDELYA